MGAIQITDDVYSVGVLNPNMRIFDIIMRTEFGTSYNAYLVKGPKNVLIDTAHPRYYEEYLENIRSVIDPAKINYVIMNHCEPDHSGALAKLLEAAPQIQVLASPAGAIYLRSITNASPLNVRVVKNNETLDIGDGKVLRFIHAPFLHWPDSMFTWLESEKIVFTCDFLGAHYCEPRMIDRHVTYPERYRQAFREYFDAIFGPFKPYVLKGLDKLEPLGAETVCTSHGPILTKGVYLESARRLYREWSTPEVREHPFIPLFYCSAYGNTERLAREITRGIREVRPDAKVEIYDINANDFAGLHEKLNNCDAFLLGTPTINRDAVLPVWKLACSVAAVNSKGRLCSVFGSFGWSGEGVPMVIDRLRALKMNVFEDGLICRFIPSQAEIQKAYEFGKRFAQAL